LVLYAAERGSDHRGLCLPLCAEEQYVEYEKRLQESSEVQEEDEDEEEEDVVVEEQGQQQEGEQQEEATERVGAGCWNSAITINA
jgi:hypothetical protein